MGPQPALFLKVSLKLSGADSVKWSVERGTPVPDARHPTRPRLKKEEIE
jgi:hypothetical protein